MAKGNNSDGARRPLGDGGLHTLAVSHLRRMADTAHCHAAFPTPPSMGSGGLTWLWPEQPIRN